MTGTHNICRQLYSIRAIRLLDICEKAVARLPFIYDIDTLLTDTHTERQSDLSDAQTHIHGHKQTQRQTDIQTDIYVHKQYIDK